MLEARYQLCKPIHQEQIPLYR